MTPTKMTPPAAAITQKSSATCLASGPAGSRAELFQALAATGREDKAITTKPARARDAIAGDR